jgi:beta-xylosidase
MLNVEIKRIGLGVAMLLASMAVARGQDTPASWGDQGDGTYKNPVLKSDFSDPDVVRVSGDFYLIASDFHYVGMQVLHSKDLVNWQIIGQVFNKLTMDPKYDLMAAYGQGTWAPSIRYHNGEFYIYVCTPYDGLFMWHAKNPAGPWSATVTVKKIPQWEDPCPFWDDDGQAYLVHSHKGAGPLYLHRMSADGTTLLDDGKLIYQGKNSEGPKMYKRHGYYYISLPEGGVATGGQVMLRSKNIYGPYERRQVLPDGSPHQGGMVELDNGEGWFISFKSTGFLGRISYLNPVHWGSDDWPVFGDNGKAVDSWKKPDVGGVYPISHPQTSDEFDSAILNPIWQWNHNPVNENWSLMHRPGWLRLSGLPADSPALARNTLTQKIWDSNGSVTVKMDAQSMTDGQRAGFTFVSGNVFAWIGVAQEKSARRISWDGDLGSGPVLTGTQVFLRGVYHADAAQLWYSLDGENYIDTNQHVKLKFANWKGARVGMFCFGPGRGSADFDYFHYVYGAN